MGHKIFVSYKYADDQVANLAGQRNSTVRDYVDKLEDYFDSSSHIYKGESSGEDLSQLEEETIWSNSPSLPTRNWIYSCSRNSVRMSCSSLLSIFSALSIMRCPKKETVNTSISCFSKNTTADE